MIGYIFKPYPPCYFYSCCGQCPYFNNPFCEYREEEKDD